MTVDEIGENEYKWMIMDDSRWDGLYGWKLMKKAQI